MIRSIFIVLALPILYGSPAFFVHAQTPTETPQNSSPDNPTVAETPAPHHETSASLEELEELQEFFVQYENIRNPKELFRFYMRICVQKRNFKTAKFCMAFSPQAHITEATQRDYLYKWSYIIERLQDVDSRDFPSDKTLATYPFTTAKGLTVELEFVKNVHGFWQLAPSATQQTNTLFKDVLGDPPVRNRFLTSRVPPWMFHLWGEMSYLQWTMLVGGFIVGILVYMIVLWTLYLVTLAYTRMMHRNVSRHATIVLRQMASIAMVIAWYRLYIMNVREPEWTTWAFYGCMIFVVAMSVLILLKLVDLVSEIIHSRLKAAHSLFDDLVVPLFSRTMKGTILAIGAVSLASAFDLPVIGLISGMGIGGVTIALAAKETVANLFGSFAVLIDAPFTIGDWIVTDGIEGTVEAVGMRSTRIRTFYNSIVTIPNTKLTTAVIDNMGKRIYRRYRTFLNLYHDTDPDRIAAFCEGIREIVRRNPAIRQDHISVHLNEIKPSAIEIIITIFFICPDTETERRERADILSNILRLAKTMDVRFAHPTQTLHLHTGESFDNAALPVGDPFEAGRTAADRVLPTGDSVKPTA